jgi:hypothetical protein
MGLGLPEAGVEAQCSTTEDIGSMIMSSGVPVLRVQNLSCGQSFRSDSQGLLGSHLIPAGRVCRRYGGVLHSGQSFSVTRLQVAR